VIESVNHLRTVRVHNLSRASKGDEYKKRQAEIWLAQNGGAPVDWTACCRNLCDQVAYSVQCLENKWRDITASAEDADLAVRDLVASVDREWPPHSFDRMVESAANEIGLRGLDCIKYRESRLDKWRQLEACFETREHAQVAVSAAIHRELEQVFGSQVPQSSIAARC
jgi:hypothetical protein